MTRKKARSVGSVGIDVSKDKLDICILASVEQMITNFQVANTKTGIDKLEKVLKKYGVDVGGDDINKDVPIVVESTGDYHIFLALVLHEHNFDIRLINPIISDKKITASIRKVKSDKRDALRLAELGIYQKNSLYRFNDSRKQVIIRKKINLIHTLEKKKEALVKSLKSIKVVIDQISPNETEDKKEKECNNNNNKGIKAVEAAIESINKAILKLKKEIVDYYYDDPDLERLSKISGVSKQSASVVLSQIKNKNFKSKSELTAFCGLDVSVRQSGRYRGKTKLSKRGNAYLRHVLFQMAWGLKMHQDKFKQLFDYYQNKGKHYYECLNILARKFLHILFGMLKHQTDFDPNKVIIPA